MENQYNRHIKALTVFAVAIAITLGLVYFDIPHPFVNEIELPAKVTPMVPEISVTIVNPVSNSEVDKTLMLTNIFTSSVPSMADLNVIIQCTELPGFKDNIIDESNLTDEGNLMLVVCKSDHEILDPDPLDFGEVRFFGREYDNIDMYPAFAAGATVEVLSNFDSDPISSALSDGVSRIWVTTSTLHDVKIKLCRNEFEGAIALTTEAGDCPPHESGDSGFTISESDAECLTNDVYSCYPDDEGLYAVRWVDFEAKVIEFIVKPQIAGDIDALVYLKVSAE